jgi:hypothetical protein
VKFLTLMVPILSICLLPGCTWVKPTALGENVIIAETSDVADCTKVGTTTSYVKDNIGPMDRNENKVRKELTILAKNRAAEMSGDTIVAEGPVENGSLRFMVYQCQ